MQVCHLAYTGISPESYLSPSILVVCLLYVAGFGPVPSLVHRCARLGCSVCGVLGNLAPVHRCAHSVCCVSSVLGHLAPIHRCAWSVCCVARAVSLATRFLFAGVPARSVVLHVRCV